MKLLTSIVRLSLVNALGIFFLVSAYHSVSFAKKQKQSADVVQQRKQENTHIITESVSDESSFTNKGESSPLVVQSPKVPPVDNRCIILIGSVQYDVTEFRNRHSGGNIFTCNTDMTTIFYNQHTDQMLKQLEQYKIQ